MNYWKIHIPKRVVKNLKKLPQDDKRRILKILQEFAVNPWQGDIVEIKDIERRTSKTY